ncbi:MAG: SPASM domain-containing protein [Bacteroidia bacterium]|nr:SPASM domain-containing protein [Bacteroidia bacterium]
MLALSVINKTIALYKVISDLINIGSSFTFPRFINLIKSEISYLFSLLIHRPVIFNYPWSLTIEPTTYCNLNCASCPTGTGSIARPQGEIDFGFYKKIIDETSRYIFYLMLYFQGEPYLHTGLFDMLKYARKKKIYTVLSTNGHFFSDDNIKATVKSGLNRLIISVDGTDQEAYSAYRAGGNLDKVLTDTKKLIDYRNSHKLYNPCIIMQFIVTKSNQHQIGDIKKLSKRLGTDYVSIKTAQLFDYKYGNRLIPDISSYSRYKKLPDGTYIIKNKLKNRCKRIFTTGVITWNGDVIPCCFDKNGRFIIGNMNENNFSSIWENKNFQEFRTSLFRNRKAIDICTNCIY